jgi:hypothetical protein
MQKSKINLLLEEIANEIKTAEKKNRELYASAIDIEDEAQSLKVQNESFVALRKMRGLKAAMDTFKSQLEKSGIIKGDGDLGEGYSAADGGEVFVSNEHSPIIVPREPEKDPADEDSDDDFEQEPEESEDDYLVPEEVIEIDNEPADEETEETEDVSDDEEDDDDIRIFSGGDFDDDDNDEAVLSEALGTVDSIVSELGKTIEEINDDSMIDDLDELHSALDDLADDLDELHDDDLDLQIENDEPSVSTDRFELDFDSGVVFDEIEFAGEPETESSAAVLEPQESQEPEWVPPVRPEPEPEPVQAAPAAPAVPDDDFSGFGMMTNNDHVGIYSGRTPVKFSMFGRQVDVKDWADMLIKVCEILILKNPYTVAQFDKYSDLNPLGGVYFSYNQGDIKVNAKKLSNGLWIETQRTPDDIVMLCKKVLELCGYPRSELEIEFND